jgi:hypothetical protein
MFQVQKNETMALVPLSHQQMQAKHRLKSALKHLLNSHRYVVVVPEVLDDVVAWRLAWLTQTL